MYETLILVGVLLIVLGAYVYSIQLSIRNMPPGPFVFPFGFGSVPGIYLDITWNHRRKKVLPWEYLSKLAAKYGDVFSLCGGPFDLVILNSYDTLMEVANLQEYSMKIANKYLTYSKTFGKEMGILFAGSAPLWTEMRKFSVRTLRQFGFGKEYTMQSIIIEESNLLSKDFQEVIENGDGIIKIRNTFSLTVLNVLWCMVAGVRYKHDDPKFVTLTNHVFSVSKSTSFANPLELFVPYGKRLMEWAFPKYELAIKTRHAADDYCHAFSKKVIEERRAVGVYLTEPESYVDVFLQKMHDSRNDHNTLYTEEQLQSMMLDLLSVGSLTLNGTLNYAILFLILNPEMQKRIQDEIDAVVPVATTPTIEQVKIMPYFQAFIMETHRCANVIPNPIPRLTPKDWNFRGYRIPKGTMIISNHFAVHSDKTIWGDPGVFRPDRFINKNGEFVPDPRVIWFGFGKRHCIGINLVDAIVPVVLATLLQKFTFSVVAGTPRPTTRPEIGVSLTPLEFSTQVTKRVGATT